MPRLRSPDACIAVARALGLESGRLLSGLQCSQTCCLHRECGRTCRPRCQAGAGLTACAKGDAALRLGETGGAPHPRPSHCWQAFGKDPARALGSRAPEAPDLQVELADTALPRQVAEAADVSAVDTVRWAPAKGT